MHLCSAVRIAMIPLAMDPRRTQVGCVVKRYIMIPLILSLLTVDSAAERKRKRKSRWGGTEKDKTFIPGMPTILPSTLDPAQQEAYLGNVVKSLVHVEFSQ